MKRLAIVGASGHGLVVADAAQRCGWDEITFFDDAWPATQSNGEWLVQGNIATLYATRADYDGVVIAIGSNTVRASKQLELLDMRIPIISIIHPAAIVSDYATIGIGCVVVAGVVVNPGAVVGDGVILNTSCSVDHDCVLEDYVHISPGVHLAGNVHVGSRAWVGIGASVRQGVRIGRDAVVGVGAAVVADVPDGQCVVGVPARPMNDAKAT